MSTEREKFEHFLTLCDDYETTKQAFKTAEQGAKDISAAVAERIEGEKEQVADRLAELKKMVADTSRPASARRVWQQELSRLQARTFAATEEEEFDSEIAAAEEAKGDLLRLQREIRDVSDSVKEAIAALRSKTYGDQQPGLMGNWLEGTRKEFDRLCREVKL